MSLLSKHDRYTSLGNDQGNGIQGHSLDLDQTREFDPYEEYTPRYSFVSGGIKETSGSDRGIYENIAVKERREGAFDEDVEEQGQLSPHLPIQPIVGNVEAGSYGKPFSDDPSKENPAHTPQVTASNTHNEP